ncbi:hypothetical protein DYB32_004117 [Aphanomyces invadans]|uniref:Large ribosomal subunit protein uL4m n=1 Tax=Aphanomyces invadans TaxID=157072 RepID=A0A3R6WNE9_9STRA|nr:hypothetical protein DYB32_004117 [Aphanomyces invadans]
MSLLRAFQALRVSAPSTGIIARNFSASTALPANLYLAPVKPVRELRVISREPVVFDKSGNIQAKVLSFADGSVSEKTKTMKALLTSKGWDHALFVDGEEADRNFVLATRNLPTVDIIRQQNINVYAILHKDLLVLSEKTVKYLEERLAVE